MEMIIDINELAQRIVKVVYDEDNYYDAYESVEEILKNYTISADAGTDSIELILEEASAYGLRYEVEYTTNKFMILDSNLSKHDATEMAFNECVNKPGNGIHRRTKT